MYYVYVLQSIQFKRYYVGSTGDHVERLRRHNAGLTTSTKAYKPYELLYLEKYGSRSDALKREKQIKRFKGGNEFKKLIQTK